MYSCDGKNDYKKSGAEENFKGPIIITSHSRLGKEWLGGCRCRIQASDWVRWVCLYGFSWRIAEAVDAIF